MPTIKNDVTGRSKNESYIVDATKGDITEVENRATALETDIEIITKRLERLTNRVENRATALETDIEIITKRLERLTNRVEKLETLIYASLSINLVILIIILFLHV